MIIGLCIVGLFLEISGLIWSSKKDKPSEVFLKLSEPPVRSIDNPLENGYFLLLGLASAPGSDPVQTGYDIWLEADAKSSLAGFDFEKPGRSDLRIPVSLDHVLPEWNSPDPLEEFRRHDGLFRTSVTRYSTLLKRYEQWLRMRFEDWGYAHRGVPRVEEVLGTHRLYVAEGFRQHTTIGLERLTTDLARWRLLLREARTLSMKLMAAVMVEDDAQLLSRILNHPTVDRTILTRGLHLLQPLAPGEYSLRWPVQNQFVLSYARTQHPDQRLLLQDDAEASCCDSLAHAAHLQPAVFRAIEHPRIQNVLGMTASSQHIWDTYAAFYEATIKAADSVHSPLPKLHDVARHSRLTLLERIVSPLEFSPNWEPLSQRLVETDARLRLVALQILLRNPRTSASLPTRLAEVGSRYFDPFTGFPMLWSPTQKKLYSVGKDGLDDGGDPTFDISVPLTMANDSPSSPGPHVARR
jgi:hypothetical protein